MDVVVPAVNLAGHETRYLIFTEQTNGRLKTRMWTVESKSGHVLGIVMWFGRWRQYTFQPADNTVFNVGCLSDIEEFLDAAMADWRESRKP